MQNNAFRSRSVGYTFCLSLFFLMMQACSPSADVQPIHAAKNTVTVKIRNAGNIPSVKHLQIVCSPAGSGVVLDTNITGDYQYTFTSKTSNITVTASLSSATPFSSAIEIDANQTMRAYRDGSCAGNEYDLTREIDF